MKDNKEWEYLMSQVQEIENQEDSYHGGFKVTISGDTCNISSKNLSKENAYSWTYACPGDKRKAVEQAIQKFMTCHNKKKD